MDSREKTKAIMWIVLVVVILIGVALWYAYEPAEDVAIEPEIQVYESEPNYELTEEEKWCSENPGKCKLY